LSYANTVVKEMAMDSNTKFVPVKWVLAVIISMLFAAVGFAVTSINGNISSLQFKAEQLQEDKVDKDIYNRDIQDIKAGISAIVTLHLPRRGESR
jgi:hypothetical protein